MITLTLTAEYNRDTQQWEVLLPVGVKPESIILKKPEPTTDDDVPPFTDEELDELLIFEGKTAAEIAASLEPITSHRSSARLPSAPYTAS